MRDTRPPADVRQVGLEGAALRSIWFGELAGHDLGNRFSRESRYVRPLGHTAGMTLTTRMLTPETWDDFAALVEVNNGVWGGCWCMGFHPEGVGGLPHPGRKSGGEASARDARDCPPGARLRRATAASAGASSARRRKFPISRTGAPTTEGPPIRRTGGSAASSPTRRTVARALPPLRSCRHSTRSSGPAAASSRPIRSRPSSGRRSVAPICTQDRRSCMRNTASRGYGRSRSGGGSCAPRSDPAARRRSRKVMLPCAGTDSRRHLGIFCRTPRLDCRTSAGGRMSRITRRRTPPLVCLAVTSFSTVSRAGFARRRP